MSLFGWGNLLLIFKLSPAFVTFFPITFFSTKTEITFSQANLLYKESMYIVVCTYQHIQFSSYIHPCRKTSCFTKDQFRVAWKQQWFEYSCTASRDLFIDWHTSKHLLFTAVNRQIKWIIHESDFNCRNSCEAKSAYQSLSSAILLENIRWGLITVSG